MKKLILFGILSFSVSLFAISSPFPSTVDGVSIPNTQLLAQDQGFLLRGMQPRNRKDVRDLVRLGVTDVLIFRNDVKKGAGGNKAEEKMLLANGIKKVHKIPFKWKDIGGFSTPCRQSIRALKILKNHYDKSDGGLFFHCTVGEDRTGYLAGLFLIVFEGKDPRQVFKTEMCGHGYADGDPKKPRHVSQTVHQNLTPLYFKMVELVRQGALSAENLDEKICEEEPEIRTPPSSC